MEKDKSIMTASLEDYLEAVLMIAETGKTVRITDLAENLGVSKPSVNRAINTLAKLNYLTHETYGEVVLTPEGETYAANVLRRHRMLKKFLTQTLGVDEDTAEDDACKMEHVMSAKTIDKLYKYLEGQS